MTTCPNCRHEVPDGHYCVRCGAELAGESEHSPARARGDFVAAPNERLSLPFIVSSLFPQLPRADMVSFRATLGLGTATVVVLVLFGLFPVAVLAAALLIPLLTVIYLYDVDVYEDEPALVVALTMGWGALCGVGVALLTQATTDTGAKVVSGSAHPDVLSRGVLLPLLGVALMLVGPLVLLPYRRFNDVLDGATFGAASAVSFVAAEVITFGVSLLGAGVHPDAEVAPWVVRILTIAVTTPVLVMAAIASATAAFWLRYRVDFGDRAALGLLSNPALAVFAAAALIVLGSVGQPLLPSGLWLATLVVLDVIALLWLRRVIHVGLLEEASEIEIGPEFVCANCGARTARHSYCSNCGISLQALPKQRKPGSPPPTPGESPSEAGA
jgi:hypothetical protein